MTELRKALILDRDGTINVDKHYLIDPAQFEFEKHVPEVLKAAFEAGYLLIVITNQSGVARGYFSEDDVDKLHIHIQERARRSGFEFADFFVCPHYHKGSVPKYSIECNCRKPETLLLEKAVVKHNLDTAGSFLIGDKDADILLGQAMGLQTVLVGTGYGQQFKNSGLKYNYFIEDFSGLPEIIGAAQPVRKTGGA